MWQGLKSLFTIPTLLLVVIIYFFRNDIFIAGVNLYASTSGTSGSAFSHRLLGDYYFDLAQRSELLAQKNYEEAVQKYNAELSQNLPDGQMTTLKYALAHSYECLYASGSGDNTSLATARRWYTEVTNGTNAGLTMRAKEAISRVGNKGSKTQLCPLETPLKTFQKFMSGTE